MSGKEMCTAEIKLISCGGEAAEGAAAEEFAAEEIAVRGRMREEEDCVTFFFRTDEAAFCLTFGRGVRIVRTGSVAYTLQLEPGGTCAACIRTPYGEIAAEARVAEQFLERTPERLITGVPMNSVSAGAKGSAARSYLPRVSGRTGARRGTAALRVAGAGEKEEGHEVAVFGAFLFSAAGGKRYAHRHRSVYGHRI